MHDWSVPREAALHVWPINALVRVYIYMMKYNFEPPRGPINPHGDTRFGISNLRFEHDLEFLIPQNMV